MIQMWDGVVEVANASAATSGLLDSLLAAAEMSLDPIRLYRVDDPLSATATTLKTFPTGVSAATSFRHRAHLHFRDDGGEADRNQLAMIATALMQILELSDAGLAAEKQWALTRLALKRRLAFFVAALRHDEMAALDRVGDALDDINAEEGAPSTLREETLDALEDIALSAQKPKQKGKSGEHERESTLPGVVLKACEVGDLNDLAMEVGGELVT